MYKKDTIRLLQYLGGELSPQEEVVLKRKVAREPELQQALHQVEAVQGILQNTIRRSAEGQTRPNLADRVVRGLEGSRRRLLEEEFFLGLVWLFRRVALGCLVLILGLIVYNGAKAPVYEATPTATEAVFGLPPVSLAVAEELGF